MGSTSRTASQARRFGVLPFGPPPRGQSPSGTPPHPWDYLAGLGCVPNNSLIGKSDYRRSACASFIFVCYTEANHGI